MEPMEHHTALILMYVQHSFVTMSADQPPGQDRCEGERAGRPGLDPQHPHQPGGHLLQGQQHGHTTGQMQQ